VTAIQPRPLRRDGAIEGENCGVRSRIAQAGDAFPLRGMPKDRRIYCLEKIGSHHAKEHRLRSRAMQSPCHRRVAREESHQAAGNEAQAPSVDGFLAVLPSAQIFTLCAKERSKIG
jgi:hypothetical protein